MTNALPYNPPAVVAALASTELIALAKRYDPTVVAYSSAVLALHRCVRECLDLRNEIADMRYQYQP